MNLQELAYNVRRLRTAKRFSQQNLADAAGISSSAVKNLEGEKSEPRMRTVQAIAQALDVKLADLFLPVRKLQTVRFRSSKRMQFRENILADTARWLDDFNYLERVLDKQVQSKLRKIPAPSSRDDCIKAAKQCRNRLGLKPTEPIHDICGLLEHCGVKIYPLSYASDDFFGLSVGRKDGGPAIVVNVYERISIERRIFSVAHELGHLIMHRDAYDVDKIEENPDEEKQADLFAGHFIMPDKGFAKEWNEAAGLHWVDRVLKVKRKFNVSYKTVLHRLIELSAVDDSIWKKFNIAFKMKFRRKLSYKEEPVPLKPVDFSEDRFSRLARRAVEEDKISLSRGAEMLRVGIEDMRDLLHDWEVVL